MTEIRNDQPDGAAARDPISTAAMLSEPVRRALYDFVAGRDDAVDRDEAAAAAGIGRPLAAFHLDRLAAAGLLDVEYRRRSGRTGPGAGRPAKLYRRAKGLTIELSLPARRYRLAAEILADGLDRHGDAASRDDVHEAARERGAALGAAATSRRSGPRRGRRSRRAAREELITVLADEGFEPRDDGTEIRLRNCPFDALVTEHRGLTCSMNLALLDGLATSVGDSGLDAVARPVEGLCCVRLVPSAVPAASTGPARVPTR
jgi:predicted ArsR family transcriptional regulator